MLNKQGFDKFREELEQATKALAEKYGVTITAGKINYSDTDFTVQLKVVKNGIPFEKVEFEKYCKAYGFNPGDYRRAFMFGDEKVYLVGFRPKAPKYPLIVVGTNGSKYYLQRPIGPSLNEWLRV